jgi:hypothetical protein
MPTQYHWGLARFGKHDGFELTEQLGALTAFDRPDSLARLSHALQLRQEEIRPFAGAEILGLTTLLHRGDSYRLLTLYRYGLDRYKRDGYTALTLALRNCRADSWGWLRALRMLAQPGSNPAHSGFDDSGRPPFHCEPDSLRQTMAHPTAIFIPLNSSSLEEEAGLLDAWQKHLADEYQHLYASASPQVKASIDTRRIQIWAENPFSTKPMMVQTASIATEVEQGKQGRAIGAPKPDSLLQAYADEEPARWQRKPQLSMPTEAKTASFPPTRSSSQLLWAGAALMIIALGLGLWWWVG